MFAGGGTSMEVDGCWSMAMEKKKSFVERAELWQLFGEGMPTQVLSGLDIRVWGPGTWDLLHAVAHSAPLRPNEQERHDLSEFLHATAKHLPCPACRAHFQQLLKERLTDSDLSSREAIVKFLLMAHNDVSSRLGKRTWTFAEHERVYFRSAPPPTGGRFHVEAVIVAMVLAAMMGYKMCQRKNIKVRM